MRVKRGSYGIGGLLAFGVAFGGMQAFGGYGFVFLTWALGGGLVCAALAAAASIGLTAERKLSRLALTAGEEAVSEVAIRRRFGWLPLPWLLVTDRWICERGEGRHVLPGGAYTVTRMVFPWFAGTVRVRHQLPNMARGKYRLAQVEVSAGDPFGLFERRLKLAAGDHAVTVYPRTELVLARSRSAGGDGRAVHAPQEGMPGGTVRAYRSGDPIKRIHWAQSARGRGLMTKETTPEDGAPVVILLDACSAAAVNAGDAFERIVRICAGMLRSDAETGRRAMLQVVGGGVGSGSSSDGSNSSSSSNSRGSRGGDPVVVGQHAGALYESGSGAGYRGGGQRLGAAMEMLASAEPAQHGRSYVNEARRVVAGLPRGTVIRIVSPVITEELIRFGEELRSARMVPELYDAKGTAEGGGAYATSDYGS